MTPIWAVVIASLATTVVSPLVLWWVAHATRRQEWTRQDQVAARTREVAEQAAKAAKLLIASNEQIAQVQRETASAAVRATAETSAKLDQIHTLVNSNMTAAMTNELDATIRTAAMMRELIEVKRAAGLEPTADVLALVETTQAKVDELQANLADRLQQTAIADRRT